jgi:hypothetical protein
MLLADNNRDGYMRFEDYLDQTHFNQSYRFWINNDSDQNGGDTSNPAEDNPWAAVKPDCDLGQIGESCQRNMEDFTRFHVYAPDKENWYSTGLVAMKLKWQKKLTSNPELRLYPAVETDGGRKYLNDETICENQTKKIALTPVLGSGNCVIPKELYNTDGKVYLIYEGVKRGEGRITANISYQSKLVGESGALYSDIQDIRDMYKQMRVNDAAVFPEPNTETLTLPSGVSNIEDPYAAPLFYKDAWDEDTDNKSYTICVHGWDKTWYAARSDEQTVFKRIWQRGFKGRYIGFYWPTKTGKTTYNQSEYVAWNCGAAFKGLIDSLPPDYKKNVIAHSMGNIVVGSAIANGATIENYAILNSAVPAQCYDPLHGKETARTQYLLFSKMGWGGTIPVIVPYPPFVVHITGIDYSAWNKPELSDDSVFVSLGYKGRITPTSANLVNYYLSNDEATLDLWEANQWGAVDIPFYIDSKIVNDYTYDPAIELYFNYFGYGVRNLTDKYEVMSMVNQSRTKSSGGSVIEVNSRNPLSAIHENVDLAGFGFGSAGVGNNLLHECVFTRRICTSWAFYESLLKELKYTPTP